MKVLKILAAVIGLVVLAVIAVGMALDGPFTVERSNTVKATPEQTLAYIGELRNWNEWTVWTKEKYPDMKVEYPGPSRGVGAIQKWNDGSMDGVIAVTAFEPDSHMDYSLDMDNGSWAMQCRISAVAVEAGSVVTWACAGDAGKNPVSRIMMTIFKPLIGDDFQGGLDKLADRFAVMTG